MALKRKIDKETFESLEEIQRGFYVEKDGAYLLDLDDEDTGALLRAKEHEKEARKKVEAEAKALREKLQALEDDGIRKRGDVEALDKSWQEKYSKALTEVESKYGTLKNSIRKQLLDTHARAIAVEISNAPSLMSKAILERLDVDFDAESGPALRILDQTGKPSALTLDELKKEFVANKEYAPIIIGSKASGGSATSTSFKASGASDATPNKPLSRMSPTELKALIDSKGEK